MKKYIFIFVLISSIVLLVTKQNVYASGMVNEKTKVIVLKGTDETKDGFPIYEMMDDDKLFIDIYNKSFIKKSAELYYKAQQYSNLKSEEIYFAFKEDSGCYGNIGFYLKEDGKLIDKTNSPYIELSNNLLNGKYDKLGSITQMLPHEMGHVLYKITTNSNKEIDQNVVDVHYSNITTEYSTAFNEGFAEHFEVISRMFEENNEIKEGIYNDIEKTQNSIRPVIDSAIRDFVLPLRLDYYRENSPFWQSKYENLKRHELGLNGDGKYKNLTYNFFNPEKSILYRNMGLAQNKSKMKSLEQSISTEIVISNFFIKLIITDNGDLNERYSKVFNVFNKYLNKGNEPQIIQFVKGYMKEYPTEKKRILNIFKESTGYDFKDQCSPEIWCICEGQHSNIILDQFNGVNISFYIFNINTCEKEDLLKLKGINKNDAEEIINYRDKNNGFKDINEISKIEGIGSESVKILIDNTNKEKIEKLTQCIDERDFEKCFPNIFLADFKHLTLMIILWFVIFSMIYYLFVAKSQISLLKVTAKELLKFIFYVLIGFVSVSFSNKIKVKSNNLNPIIIFLIVIFICEMIRFFAIRKDKLGIKNSFISTLMMLMIIIYSLY